MAITLAGSTLSMGGADLSCSSGSWTSAPTGSVIQVVQNTTQTRTGYNSSGSLAFQFRTGWPAGRGPQPAGLPTGSTTNTQPRTANVNASPGTWVYEASGLYPSGSLSFVSDSLMATGSGQPGPTFVSGSASALAQYIVVKANN